jgi:hypothetical protein
LENEEGMMTEVMSEEEIGRVREIMKGYTYATVHNPNCLSPYLVRLPQGCLDFKYYGVSRDALGFGKTEEAAFLCALSNLQEKRRKWLASVGIVR